MERIALFVDGANLFGASRALGFDIDYQALLGLIRRESYLVRAYYYTALVESDDYSQLRPLVDWLAYNGFTVVTKAAREFTDAAGRRRYKGNIELELACDVLELAPKVDHVVLAAGDGDYRRVVEAVQRMGVRVTVLSTIKSQPPVASDELRRQADQFLDLADLAPEISRRTTEPRSRTAAPARTPAAPPSPAPITTSRATPADPFGDAGVPDLN